MIGEREISRKQFNQLAVGSVAAITARESMKLFDEALPASGREMNPLANTSLPALKVEPVGSWPLDLDSPEAKAFLFV